MPDKTAKTSGLDEIYSFTYTDRVDTLLHNIYLK